MEYTIIDNSLKAKEEDTVTTSLVEKPAWSLNEIVLSDDIIKQTEEITSYMKHRDKLLHDWGFERFLKLGNGLTINFFGQPGTGKSITAEAIAHKLGMTIIKASYGELESEFVGRTSKNLGEIFKKAEESNSLLFFDEADSLLSKRITNLSQSADYGVNTARSTLLTLLDKFNSVVIFATNLFDNYDEAFLRRIIFHIEFPLPNYDMRVALWKFHISNNVPRDISYERASEISDGLSGGDIKNVTIKLGLKLLANRFEKINEDVLSEEIKKYKKIKERHDKNYSLNKDSVLLKEHVSSTKQSS